MDMMDNSFGVTHIPTTSPRRENYTPLSAPLLMDMMDNSFGVTHIPTISDAPP